MAFNPQRVAIAAGVLLVLYVVLQAIRPPPAPEKPNVAHGSWVNAPSESYPRAKPSEEWPEYLAVAECDFAAKARLISPATYDTAWTWKTDRLAEHQLLIRREFDAQNGFGALIRNEYLCTVDTQRRVILDLSFARQ